MYNMMPVGAMLNTYRTAIEGLAAAVLQDDNAGDLQARAEQQWDRLEPGDLLAGQCGRAGQLRELVARLAELLLDFPQRLDLLRPRELLVSIDLADRRHKALIAYARQAARDGIPQASVILECWETVLTRLKAAGVDNFRYLLIRAWLWKLREATYN